MNRAIGRGFFLAAAAAALAILFRFPGVAAAAPIFNPQSPSVMRMPGNPDDPGAPRSMIMLGGRNYHSGTVFAAYQKAYAMNFEIWKPMGLPGGWYATFDGFPVAQIQENLWVYGRMGVDGALVPTDVLVGSVVPMDVPGLTRVATTWVYTEYINSREFQKIRELRCDNMGYLDGPMARTAVAWNSREPGAWVWLADHWKKITPLPGEYTWEAVRRRWRWILVQLHGKGFRWLGAEPMDLADLARMWGFLWRGRVLITDLTQHNTGGNDDSTGEFSISVSGPASDPQPQPSDPGGGQWDVGDDVKSGGAKSGGWDTGGM